MGSPLTAAAASPASSIPPPSVLDGFERNPVRRNTAPLGAPGRAARIYRPVVAGAESVVLKAAEWAGVAWRAPKDVAVTAGLTGLTVWVIVLTVHLQRSRGDISALTTYVAELNTDLDTLSKAYFDAPICQALGATPGP